MERKITPPAALRAGRFFIRLFPWVFLLCAGCSTLPLDSTHIPHPSSRSRSALAPAYREMIGVIHIHSTYSDGMLPVEAIAKIASQQNLDYIIITDHDTLRAEQQKKTGWFNRTLVLAGDEISTRAGHYLALRVSKEIPRLQGAQWTAEAVSAQGGLGFIAHPLWKRRPWKAPEVQGITGMEIYSAVQDAQEENFLWLGFWTIFTGSDFSLMKWLDRPDATLALWDRRLAQRKKVVGIGSPDAHVLRRFGLRLAPYAAMFKLVRNHLLVTEFSPEAVYDALERGHLFVGFDTVADAKGFYFAAVCREKVEGVMGDTVRWKPDLRLYAYLPSPGEMALIKDGKVFARFQGQKVWFDVPGPGVYRIEATRKGKPWIYSNPIYVIS